jgi:hypothetical protein
MIEMPSRMERLARDKVGRPVPWFVWWDPESGEPDFRVIGPGKMEEAYHHSKCWVCGEGLGVYRVFVIGPMCAVNRVSGELPSHRECARYSAKACPFLTTPRMHRNEKGLPAEYGELGGVPVKRNPGVTLLWITRSYWPIRDPVGKYVFKLGPPEGLEFYREGRAASRREVMESIDSGMPILREMAERDGGEAVGDLEQSYWLAVGLVQAAIPEGVGG